MRVISDLTRDIRPSLEELLVKAIQDTIAIDRQQEIMDGEFVEQENNTFYFRVIYLFMQRSILYYSYQELEDWSKTKLLNEVVLPPSELYRIDSRK